MKTIKRKNGTGSVLANLAGMVLLVAVAVGLMFGASSAQATIVLSNDFGSGTDIGPAFQEVANGLGTGGSSDPSTGVITTGLAPSHNDSAYGLNTSTTLDLSGYSGFTIDWVVSSGTGVDGAWANGWFFGVSNSTNSDGTGLWNNTGEAAGLLMLSSNYDDWKFQSRHSGSFAQTDLNGSIPTTASFEDGFTLSLTLNSDDTWSASSTGLSNNIDLTNQALVGGQTYADLASTVVANTSIQGSDIGYTVDNVTISTIPEPASLGLIGLMGAILLIRRRLYGNRK